MANLDQKRSSRVATPKGSSSSNSVVSPSIDLETALTRAVGFKIRLTTRPASHLPSAIEGILFAYDPTLRLAAICTTPTFTPSAPADYRILPLSVIATVTVPQTPGQQQQPQGSTSGKGSTNNSSGAGGSSSSSSASVSASSSSSSTNNGNVTGNAVAGTSYGEEIEAIALSGKGLDVEALRKREEEAIRAMKARDASRNMEAGVVGQAVFDWFARQFSTRWEGTNIIVDNAVRIDKPYQVADVKAPRDKEQAKAHIIKVLSGFWAKNPNQSGSSTPGGSNTSTSKGHVVMPALPRNGG